MFDEALLLDLAGNAFSSTQFGAMLIGVLLAVSVCQRSADFFESMHPLFIDRFCVKKRRTAMKHVSDDDDEDFPFSIELLPFVHDVIKHPIFSDSVCD